MPGTIAITHYFYVCSDDIARKEKLYLNVNPPDEIIWMDIGEEVWLIHETVFIGGKISRQREIQ